jgi:hypothetical protein
MKSTALEEVFQPESLTNPRTLRADTLQASSNPAIARLGKALNERDDQSGIQSYSRTYHRHSRSHTRK